MSFRHSANGHVVTVRHSFLWCFLFGGLYFMKHDAWSAGIIAIVVAICTVGLAWLIYPFFAKGIVRTSYLRRGWTELSSEAVAA